MARRCVQPHRVLEWIALNYSMPDATLLKVASDFGVSRCHLGQALIRDTGKPFREHLTAARMERAARALRQKSRVVLKEVAYECGYVHTGNFVRDFCHYYSMTPTAFRLCQEKQGPQE
jgi:AraC-like DNA-binding protein